MTIKRRIVSFQVSIAFIVTAMAIIALVDLASINGYLNRVRDARQQLAAAAQLAIYANRYSEQIAEVLLVGASEGPDFNSAREQVFRTLAVLRARTLLEAANLRNAREKQDESPEVERVEKMQTLFREIDLAVERLLLVDRQGRRKEAIELFRSEIENRLDAQFEQLIREAQQDEREEVNALEAEVARLTQWLTGATLIALIILLIVSLASSVKLARTLEHPIRALTRGAEAVESGKFDHRIAYDNPDEFGTLARRFDAMADRLGRQHDLLLGSQERLESEVQERTSQLEDANRKLTLADNQRVRFLAEISHELRTPLTALRGEAEITLRGHKKTEEFYREALNIVVARAVEMSLLIEDLLFLARSEADEIRFDMRRVDLVDLINQTIRDAAHLAQERGISLQFNDGSFRLPENWSIHGDQRRLKQAIMIPIDNALKYSKSGSGVVISASALENGCVQISIADHGPGISKEDALSAFERFYRGSGARQKWEGGSGLGLPIARWIVEKHGGTMCLSSKPEEGTTVFLKIPRHQ